MTVTAPARAAMGLGPEHQRWIVINAFLVPVVVNAILNGSIAWLSSIGEKAIPLVSVPLLQKPSMVSDTLGTLVILPFTTALVVGAAIRREKRLGRLTPITNPSTLGRLLARMPVNPMRRAGRFADMSLALLGPVSLLVLMVGNFGGISRMSFVIYKIILGIVLGLVVTPLIALAAMGDPQ